MLTKPINQPPKAIEWTPEFELGIPEIDEEHLSLLALYNDLVHALERGATQVMSQGIIRSLQRFMMDHMAREEDYIRRHAFPGADQHIREHREFSVAISALPDAEATEGAALLLRGWILDHILVSDRALFEHVKRADVAPAHPSAHAPTCP